MKARNPFASVSNFSFVRNSQHLSSEGRQARTYSSHKKYFDYQGSYMRDPYVRDWQLRRNQQQISSKLMGVQVLRFAPTPAPQQDYYSPKFKDQFQHSNSEYYNLQNQPTPKDTHPEQQPLPNSRTVQRLQKNNSNKQSAMYQSTASQRAMKCSTKDMFGSDYFNNFYGTAESEEERGEDEKLVRKSNFAKKEPANVSRFKVAKQLSQLKQEEEQSKIITRVLKNEEEPQTLFLKSRGKTFYRYHQPAYP